MTDTSNDWDRTHLARLHRLQHDGRDPETKPELGGSIVGWSADEIEALRARMTPLPNRDEQAGGWTPGPWAVSKKRSRRVKSEHGLAICTAILRGAETKLGAAKTLSEAEANACLIASAPDLLQELKVREGDFVMLIKAIEAGDPRAELLIRCSDALRETRAAIAKALGK